MIRIEAPGSVGWGLGSQGMEAGKERGGDSWGALQGEVE